MTLVETNFRTIMALSHFNLDNNPENDFNPALYTAIAEKIADGTDLFLGGIELRDTGNGFHIEDGYNLLMTLLVAKKALYDLTEDPDFGTHALTLDPNDKNQEWLYHFFKNAFHKASLKGIGRNRELEYYKIHVGIATFVVKVAR